MTLELSEAVRTFLENQLVCVVATQRRDGSVRQSLTYYSFEDGKIRISTLGTRAKAKDVQRTGSASLTIMGHEKPFPSLTIEGSARVVTSGIGEPTARIMAKIAGVTSVPPMADEALAAVGRVILEVDVDRLFNVMYIEQEAS